jgi:hypothetical protein
MSPERQTTLVLLLAVIALAAWDVYVFLRFGPQATISHVVASACEAEPIIALVLGIILGHILWRR